MKILAILALTIGLSSCGQKAADHEGPIPRCGIDTGLEWDDIGETCVEEEQYLLFNDVSALLQNSTRIPKIGEYTYKGYISPYGGLEITFNKDGTYFITHIASGAPYPIFYGNWSVKDDILTIVGEVDPDDGTVTTVNLTLENL